MASAVDSSRGSRRPDDDRQWTQARLQAYVSSHVRQIGRVEAALELLDERAWASCEQSGAFQRLQRRRRTTATAIGVDAAGGEGVGDAVVVGSASTTRTTSGCLRKISRRVP